MTIELPWPPSVNHLYFHQVIPRKVGKPFVKKGPTTECRKLMETIKAAVFSVCGQIKPSSARMSVMIAAYPPDRRSRDLDNILKPILDGLTFAGLWEDDSQVDLLAIERRELVRNGKVVVTVTRIGKEPVAQKELALVET